MPYQSAAQQRMFNARAAAGDPKFIKLARDFNTATYGRPGFTSSGRRTGSSGSTKGGAARYASLPQHVPHRKGSKVAYSRLAQSIASSKSVSPAVRARTATFKQPNRKTGQKNRFPMPDKRHARLALQMLPKAKNMPPGAAAKVRSRAHRMLGG